eukprot:TRINITY_DN654_c3_g1_i2.p1 TRINITY_DN654_c3_g1~~TRINITY_DN654_c3_g1_i2.p1  ORF type:complete len:464 (-),score=155.70 TRINITY_DN654_c3_g1_i2:51-1442(-)
MDVDNKDEDNNNNNKDGNAPRRSRRIHQKEKTKANKKPLQPRYQLKNISMRPTAQGGKRKGQFTNANNTLTYTCINKKTNEKSNVLEIQHKMIKHAVLLKNARGKNVTLIHLFLHKPLTIPGRKRKTTHLQFYNEAARSESLRKVNRRFEEFITTLQKTVNFTVDLNVDPKLVFEGKPEKNILALQPTPHCLISLALDQNFFIVLLSQVQIAYFERVKVSKSFDLVFVLDDFTTEHIENVPSDNLEDIRRWLQDASVPVYEGASYLDWDEIIEHVQHDEEAFYKNGGWNFLIAGYKGEDDEDDGDDASSRSGMSVEDEDDDDEDVKSTKKDKKSKDTKSKKQSTSSESKTKAEDTKQKSSSSSNDKSSSSSTTKTTDNTKSKSTEPKPSTPTTKTTTSSTKTTLSSKEERRKKNKRDPGLSHKNKDEKDALFGNFGDDESDDCDFHPDSQGEDEPLPDSAKHF